MPLPVVQLGLALCAREAGAPTESPAPACTPPAPARRARRLAPARAQRKEARKLLRKLREALARAGALVAGARSQISLYPRQAPVLKCWVDVGEAGRDVWEGGGMTGGWLCAGLTCADLYHGIWPRFLLVLCWHNIHGRAARCPGASKGLLWRNICSAGASFG